MHIQALYQEAIKFAARKHSEKDQKITGTDLPYLVHLSNVAMEIMIAAYNTDGFDLAFAVQVALLHDTLEDTSTSYDELKNHFGIEVANAVLALTKNKDLLKENQMPDCLVRIKKLQKEAWAVKLADRITNLQPPPAHWDKQKRVKYREEAKTILLELINGNDFLAKRLEMQIAEYSNYIVGDHR
jgi:guanosine-3',5'-bis(diphosphate) 3'-pyrophosphohydrolase